jgi:hypothetical protein
LIHSVNEFVVWRGFGGPNNREITKRVTVGGCVVGRVMEETFLYLYRGAKHGTGIIETKSGIPPCLDCFLLFVGCANKWDERLEQDKCLCWYDERCPRVHSPQRVNDPVDSAHRNPSNGLLSCVRASELGGVGTRVTLEVRNTFAFPQPAVPLLLPSFVRLLSRLPSPPPNTPAILPVLLLPSFSS